MLKDNYLFQFKQDFGDIIPGHGGIMDRFDCQFLMASFVNVYIHSFIRSASPTGKLDKPNQMRIKIVFIVDNGCHIQPYCKHLSVIFFIFRSSSESSCTKARGPASALLFTSGYVETTRHPYVKLFLHLFVFS